MSIHTKVLLYASLLGATAIFNAHATGSADVCAHFLAQYEASPREPAASGSEKWLCFEWFARCDDDDVVAEQFWKLENAQKPASWRNTLLTYGQWNLIIDDDTRYQDDRGGRAISAEADELRRVLVNDPPNSADVTEIPLQNGRTSLIRIAQRVGTRSCEKDIYIQRTRDGYKLFRDATLDGFSAEASNCGIGNVWFSAYRNADYVAHYFYDTLDVYRIDANLTLTHVCMVPQRKSLTESIG